MIYLQIIVDDRSEVWNHPTQAKVVSLELVKAGSATAE